MDPYFDATYFDGDYFEAAPPFDWEHAVGVVTLDAVSAGTVTIDAPTTGVVTA